MTTEFTTFEAFRKAVMEAVTNAGLAFTSCATEEGRYPRRHEPDDPFFGGVYLEASDGTRLHYVGNDGLVWRDVVGLEQWNVEPVKDGSAHETPPRKQPGVWFNDTPACRIIRP